MSILETDNRIRLEPPKVDFDNLIGVTGQKHDAFPSAGQQPRYDWMRSYLIGLLSNQSSVTKPTEKRTGTIWFDRAKMALMVWNDTDWVDISEHIYVDEDVTLKQWFDGISERVNRIQPRLTFSGISETVSQTEITVPTELVDTITGIDTLRPIVYINGVQVDPRNSRFSLGVPSHVELLNGVNLDEDDEFTVIIENYDVFVVENVTV